MSRRFCSSIAALVGGLAVPATGFAQSVADTSAIVVAPQLQRSDAAGARVEPGVMPQPLDLGGFLLDSSLSMVGGYDTNVFNFTEATGDAVVLLTPRMRLRANTSRHLFQLDTVAQLRRFAEVTTENSEEFRVSALTRLDLADRNSLSATGAFERLIEPRSSAASVPGAANPVSFDVARAQLGGDFSLGRLAVRPAARFMETDFQTVDLIAGGSSDQSFRNMRSYGGSLSLGYRFSDLAMIFAQGSYLDSVSTTPELDAERDSIDWIATAGVRGELSPLLVAEIGLGYRKRDFALDRFLDFEGFTYSADLEWYVTPLVTITAEAEQDFVNSGIVQVAGILSNRFALSVFYDPLRNLRLSATGIYEVFEFREADATAKRPAGRVSAQYFVNRNLSVGSFVAYRGQTGAGDQFARDFTSFSTGVGITLTP